MSEQSREYRHVDESTAVEVGTLLEADIPKREIARRQGIPESTVRHIEASVRKGKIPGKKQWSIDRYWKEVHRTSRKRIKSLDQTGIRINELIDLGLSHCERLIGILGTGLDKNDRPLILPVLNTLATLQGASVKARMEYQRSMTGDQETSQTTEGTLSQLSIEQIQQRYRKLIGTGKALQEEIESRKEPIEAQVIEAKE